MTKIRFDRAAALAGAAFLAFAMPANATNTTNNNATQPAAEASAQRADAGNNDRRICVRVQLTGSRVVRQVCKTAHEWDLEGGVPESDR